MTPSHSEKTLAVLARLIETCRDGQLGFATAADHLHDPELREFFRAAAAQRAGFLADLQERVRSLGGTPESSSSVSATLHRGWIGLRAALATHEAHAVLAECERAEDVAVEQYREAVPTPDLDPATRELVSRQAAAVLATHDRVKLLRDAAVYSHR